MILGLKTMIGSKLLKISVSLEHVPTFFNPKKTGEKIDPRNIAGHEREKLGREYFTNNAPNKFFYTSNRPLISKVSVVIFIEPNNKVSYIKIDTQVALYVRKYCQDNADKIFSKYYKFEKEGYGKLYFRLCLCRYSKNNGNTIYKDVMKKDVFCQIFISTTLVLA